MAFFPVRRYTVPCGSGDPLGGSWEGGRGEAGQRPFQKPRAGRLWAPSWEVEAGGGYSEPRLDRHAIGTTQYRWWSVSGVGLGPSLSMMPSPQCPTPPPPLRSPHRRPRPFLLPALCSGLSLQPGPGCVVTLGTRSPLSCVQPGRPAPMR